MLGRVLEELRCLLEHVLVFGSRLRCGSRGLLCRWRGRRGAVNLSLGFGLEARLGDVPLNVELGRLLNLAGRRLASGWGSRGRLRWRLRRSGRGFLGLRLQRRRLGAEARPLGRMVELQVRRRDRGLISRRSLVMPAWIVVLGHFMLLVKVVVSERLMVLTELWVLGWRRLSQRIVPGQRILVSQRLVVLELVLREQVFVVELTVRICDRIHGQRQLG